MLKRTAFRIVILATLTSLLAACDWPTFAFGPARTGHNPFESTIGLENVGALHVAWTAKTVDAQVASPVVSGGVVYVADVANRLYAFDAAGSTKCSGIPARCQPLWTAQTADRVLATPTVANGVIYVGAEDHTFYAFDAAGKTNCVGRPRRCRPLWTATPGGVNSGLGFVSSPAVVNGVVYVAAADHNLYAYDADGVTNCRRTPASAGSKTVCEPLWTGAAGDVLQSSPAVVNGVVYVGASNGMLNAFDARGRTNCSGTPPTCQPLWVGATGSAGIFGAPAVAGGTAYVDSFTGRLSAFDARGITNCSGTPTTCQPLWTAVSGALNDEVSSPAVANGFVYVASGTVTSTLRAFDAAGVTNCTGTPTVCRPIWSAASGPVSSFSAPAVANGVVYTASLDSKVSAFDAAGVENCSGFVRTCQPLWSFTTDDVIDGAPAVVNGTVYVGTVGGTLYAFAS
jgi:outer membrane protein assembly factor BamB